MLFFLSCAVWPFSGHSFDTVMKTWDFFPAYWAFQFTAFHIPLEWSLKRDVDFRDNLAIVRERAGILVRRGLTLIFLGLSFIWLIFFSICVFSYEMSQFEKGKAKGTEKESNIIIRLLDNVPWTAAMFRNVVILTVFLFRYPEVDKLTRQLLSLLNMLQTTAHHTLLDVIACSNKMLILSWYSMRGSAVTNFTFGWNNPQNDNIILNDQKLFNFCN